MELIPDAPAMAVRLGLILGGLMALVARGFLRRPRLIGLTVTLWSWLSRKRQRFERMMNRPVRAPRVAGPLAARATRERTQAVALPRGRGWLVKELGWEAAAYTSQLAALLDEPAMQAALAALPGSARLLRPVCHILGVAALALPVKIRPRPAKDAPAAAVAPAWQRPEMLFRPGGAVAVGRRRAKNG